MTGKIALSEMEHLINILFRRKYDEVRFERAEFELMASTHMQRSWSLLENCLEVAIRIWEDFTLSWELQIPWARVPRTGFLTSQQEVHVRAWAHHHTDWTGCCRATLGQKATKTKKRTLYAQYGKKTGYCKYRGCSVKKKNTYFIRSCTSHLKVFCVHMGVYFVLFVVCFGLFVLQFCFEA